MEVNFDSIEFIQKNLMLDSLLSSVNTLYFHINNVSLLSSVNINIFAH